MSSPEGPGNDNEGGAIFEKVSAVCMYIDTDGGRNSSLPTRERRGALKGHEAVVEEAVVEEAVVEEAIEPPPGTPEPPPGPPEPLPGPPEPPVGWSW